MTTTFLFQTIHTLDGYPLFLSEHIATLDAASRALFGRAFTPHHLEIQITKLLATEHHHTDRSLFVRIELDATGKFQLTTAGVSLYRGYDLRSLRPEAISLCYDIPFGDYHTPVREALSALANVRAEHCQVRSVVRCTSAGVAITGDDAPLFAVKDRIVYTSPHLPCAEHTIATRCIAAAKLELREEPIHKEELFRFDELFSFDHRGVTSYARCDGYPYMSLMAEKVAHEATRLTNNIQPNFR